MIVLIDKSFEKDVSPIKNKLLRSQIANCIESVEQATTLLGIKNLKKLKGGKQYYRIRLGDYRIGLIIKADTVTFVRLLHRKDIYNYFS